MTAAVRLAALRDEREDVASALLGLHQSRVPLNEADEDSRLELLGRADALAREIREVEALVHRELIDRR